MLAGPRWFAHTSTDAVPEAIVGLAHAEERGIAFLEGQPDQPLLAEPDDVRRVLEACFSQHSRNVLLYAPNVPRGFFDLSSGHGGAILQRLRTYGVRLVVVCPPGSIRFSSRFGEMVAEERRRQHFAIAETRDDALEWLGRWRPSPAEGP